MRARTLKFTAQTIKKDLERPEGSHRDYGCDHNELLDLCFILCDTNLDTLDAFSRAGQIAESDDEELQ